MHEPQAAKESSAAARLILLMNIFHGLQPWLSSVAACILNSDA